MTRQRSLDPLVRISGLMLEIRLSELHRIAKARAESQARLAGLATPPAEMDLPLAAAEQARLRYEGWAEARRAEINLTLSRQTAEWIEAKQTARRTFGRAEALRSLYDRASR